MDEDLYIIDADPTKELFIDTLTRDLDYTAAILDLLDNSTDAAKQNSGSPLLTGMRIILRLSSSFFAIEDNCGGMEVEVARKKAFRFGRDKAAQNPSNTIGIFGVGMKRALFKIAEEFTITSVAKTSRFVMKVSVPEWKSRAKWNFRLESFAENENNSKATLRLLIQCSKLTEQTSAAFQYSEFLNRLRDQIARRYALMINDGLSISITTKESGKPSDADLVGSSMPRLKSSQHLKPHISTLHLLDSEPRVKVSIYGGVEEKSDERLAGWSIYCNGRLIVDRDTTELTGWGTEKVPSAHHQFARFRGYVLMSCADPSRLPWNTTKTGIDPNNPLYVPVLAEMRATARNLIRMLNAARREQKDFDESDEENQPVLNAIRKARAIPLDKLPENTMASWPIAPKKAAGEKAMRVSFSREKAKVRQLMEVLDLSTPSEVGGHAFDELFDREIG